MARSSTSFVSTIAVFIAIVFTTFCVLIYSLAILSKKRNLYSIESFEDFEKEQDQTEFQEKDSYKKNNFTDVSEIYDQFYTDVYSSMITPYKALLCTFEVEDFIKTAVNTREKSLLDIGCGTGHHLVEFQKAGYDVVGLDQSSSMLEEARKKLSTDKINTKPYRLIQGDMQNINIFSASRFDYCTCYYFSFYFSSKPSQLVNNVHKWLKSNGSSIWAVHLVDPEKFDPIIDVANPFVGFSLKRYIKKNISKVYFKDMYYQSTYNYNKKDRVAKFHEKFVLPKQSLVRNQVQTLHMIPIEEVVAVVCDEKKFTVLKVTDLQSYGYEYQYIYYFQKL